MKIYNVSIKRTSYIHYEVQADNYDDAETQAWELLDKYGYEQSKDADWSCDSVEEIQQ
jgi:hypothetical protein